MSFLVKISPSVEKCCLDKNKIYKARIEDHSLCFGDVIIIDEKTKNEYYATEAQVIRLAEINF